MKNGKLSEPKLQKILCVASGAGGDARAVALGAPSGCEGVTAPPARRAEGSRSCGGTGDRPRPGFGSGAGTNIISQAQTEFRAVLDDPKHTKAEFDEKVIRHTQSTGKGSRGISLPPRRIFRSDVGPADQETVLVGLGYLECQLPLMTVRVAG